MNERPNYPDLLDDPATREADAQAVHDFVEKGKPVDPAVSARVRARSDRAREATFQRVGFIKIEELLRRTWDDDE